MVSIIIEKIKFYVFSIYAIVLLTICDWLKIDLGD
jgi:hypothetical protein